MSGRDSGVHRRGEGLAKGTPVPPPHWSCYGVNCV